MKKHYNIQKKNKVSGQWHSFPMCAKCTEKGMMALAHKGIKFRLQNKTLQVFTLNKNAIRDLFIMNEVGVEHVTR